MTAVSAVVRCRSASWGFGGCVCHVVCLFFLPHTVVANID